MAVKATATVTVFNVSDGTDGRMLYATCQTAPLTAAKVATVSSGTVTLYTGLTVAVQFMHTNTAASPTLNINGTGAKAIFVNGAGITKPDYWVAGATHTFVYDGSRWVMSDVQSVDVGGTNLVPFAWMRKGPTDMRAGTSTQDMTVSWWVTTLMTHDQLVAQFEPSGTYTCHYDAEFVEPFSGYDVVYDGKVGLLFYSPSTPSAYRVLTMLLVTQNDYSAGRTASFTTTFTLPDEFPSDYCLVGYTPYFRNSAGTPAVRSWATIRNLKIEKGTVATDWSPAPEDVQAGIDDAQGTANAVTGTVDAMNSGSRNLILNSAKPVTTSNYNVMNYTLAEDLVVGEPYSLTIWGEASQQFGGWLSDGNSMWFSPTWLSGETVSGDGFVRWEGVKCPRPINGNLRRFSIFNSPNTPGQTATIERIKLEKGSVGTAWSAAPEDVEEAKDLANAGIKEQVTLFYAAASASTPSKPTANVTTSSATTYAAWNRTLPTYRAANPYLYVCTQSLTNGGTYSWSTVESGNYADWAAALGTRLTTAETKISQNTADIALKASQTEVSSLGTRVSTAEASIDANRAQIALKVSQAQFDAMQIGGTNRVANSAGVNIDNLGATAGSRKEYSYFNTGLLYSDLKSGTEVVISFDLELTVNTANPSVQVYNSNLKGPKSFTAKTLYFTSAVGTTIKGRYHVLTKIVDQTNVNVTTTNAIEFYTIYGTSNWFKISNLKLEVGNVPTAWSPAPEDMATGAELEVTADSITQRVDGLDGDIAKVSTNAHEFSVQLQTQLNSLTGEVHSVGGDLETVTTLVRVTSEDGKPVLGLGTSGSLLELQLTNEQIKFIDTRKVVASINGQVLHISNVEVESNLRIGNFAFIPRGNGNLSLKKVV